MKVDPLLIYQIVTTILGTIVGTLFICGRCRRCVTRFRAEWLEDELKRCHKCKTCGTN